MNGPHLRIGAISKSHTLPIDGRNSAYRAYVSRYRDKDGDVDVTKISAVNPKRQHDLDIEELEAGKSLFPSVLIPHAPHPIVQQKIIEPLGAKGHRLIEQDMLVHFNEFTAWLEQHSVNDVARAIARRKDAHWFPDPLRKDANKVYLEEAKHADEADNMNEQVVRKTGLIVPLSPISLPRRLRRLLSRMNPGDRRLAKYIFAVGTETTITGILSKIPKHEDVLSMVRLTIADHADDEAKHNSFFTALFDYIYPQLDASTRTSIGPFLPELIKTFLEPDRASLRCRLQVLGLTPAEASEVVADTYSEANITLGIAAAAAGTLALFRRHGILDDARTRDAFVRAGLING